MAQRSAANTFTNHRIDPETGCWNWSGPLWPNGYGNSNSNEDSGSKLAHRAYYMHYVGEIPDPLVLDHLCCNKGCVNPEHLEPVTKAENGRRGLWSLYDGHCRKGHDLRLPDSQYVEMKTGRTMCRVCRDARDARKRDQYWARKAERAA